MGNSIDDTEDKNMKNIKNAFRQKTVDGFYNNSQKETNFMIHLED